MRLTRKQMEARRLEAATQLARAALRESRLAESTLRRIGTDASSEAHGSLTVALGALRQATEAVVRLIEIEEGPFKERSSK